MRRVYLDHASTSLLRPEAAAAMTAWLAGGPWGDAGRIHAEGLHTRAVLEDARQRIATALGARSRSVVFTSSASEAIATACSGVPHGHQVLAAVEHSAVRRSATRWGASTTIVGCDRTGRVDPDELMAAVGPDTTLVHLQWANHEVGTAQPLAPVVEKCQSLGVLVHVDAAAAAGHVPVGFDECGADLMSVSGHKMGGPAGVGALLIRRGLRLDPLVAGAEQERGRRAGLEPTLAAVGWAAACDALTDTVTIARRERALSDGIRAAMGEIDGVEILGHRTERLPHITCATVEGVEPQGVLLGLDQRNIAAHSGSACASEDLQPSPVLEAMGVDAHHSLRLSVGWDTDGASVDALRAALAPVIGYLRSLAR